ncbi:MAG TPA: cellulase family glycosylhydrolase [Polyangiaceae bacterium]
MKRLHGARSALASVEAERFALGFLALALGVAACDAGQESRDVAAAGSPPTIAGSAGAAAAVGSGGAGSGGGAARGGTGGRAAGGSAAGSGGAGLSRGGSGGSGGAAAGGAGAGGAQPTPGGYHVVANKILDANAKEHRFYGVSRPSLEWSADGDAIFDRDWDNIKSWGANIVRIPLNQVFWRTSPDYRDKVRGIVTAIESRGMDVILDLHWSEGPEPGQGAQRDLPDASSLVFWKDVASTYMADSRVLFELYNEPKVTDWNLWLNGGATGGFQAVGMKALYDAVRATGAQNLTLFGGLEFAYRLAGFPGISGGVNVVLVTHPYDTGDKQPGNWDADWGNLATSYPIIATEFGRLDSSSNPCDPGYPEQVINYANAKGVSWIGWAWYVKDCGFPSLITDYMGTPTATGAAVKAAMLAATAGH